MSVTLHDAFIGSYPVSQLFGQNPLLYKPYGFLGHEGLDFGGGINGAAAIAATQGIVLHAGMEPAWSAYGNFVEIYDELQHCAILYGHLKDVAVKVGQRVWVGQLIGHCDNTGHSTGPHLHFGLCLTDANGMRLNKGNGYGGWVNSNDPKMALWKITNPSTPAAGYPPDPIIPPPPPVEPLPEKDWKAISAALQSQVDAMKADFAKIDAIAAARK